LFQTLTRAVHEYPKGEQNIISFVPLQVEKRLVSISKQSDTQTSEFLNLGDNGDLFLVGLTLPRYI
jgi:hypothetical protein